MSLKDHLSKSLRWKWHLQDFEMRALAPDGASYAGMVDRLLETIGV